jgi:hypothetical protein
VLELAVLRGEGLVMGDDVDLIAAIYDAAIDFEQWPLVLERMLGASAGCLVRQNLITAKGKMIAVRVDPKFGQLYDDYYCSRNILPNRAGRPPVNRPHSRSSGGIYSDRILQRFYEAMEFSLGLKGTCF